ncbi:hypothetical protein [Chitinimonas lacunae]|uniref:Uncharacterized protein n=1 Tax=Chitinimonas lacunae TaxID=1963018 RepID=A0ABV8MJJ1_9NEIS
MEFILGILSSILNAYTAHPRDPVLIMRYGAVRGMIGFGAPALIAVLVSAMLQPPATPAIGGLPSIAEVLVLQAQASSVALGLAAVLWLVTACFAARFAWSFMLESR